MKKTAFLALFVGTALGMAHPTAAAPREWNTHSCEYMNLEKNIHLSGKCVKQEAEMNGNFAYILKWPSGDKVTVEFVKAQSGNHIWNLNGQPAVGFEINRENLNGFSLDLNQSIKWKDR